ncbi:MAG: O-antigen ligase family protein, partial [Bacteroidota bacterium]
KSKPLPPIIGITMLQIKYQTLIFQLLCAYVFLIPFEHILEIFYGIDTVLKPYRIFALAIIGVYAIRLIGGGPTTISKDIKIDFFLYLLLLYGIVITMLQVFLNHFETRHFYNDSFQTFLYVSVFFIIKNTELSYEQIRRLLWFFTIGIALNALYLFNNFYLLQDYRRQSGFMDNPNYVAISLVIAIAFVFLQIGSFRRWSGRILAILGLFFLLLMLVIAGSRTGFIISILLGSILFFYASWSKKMVLLSGVVLLLLLSSGRSGLLNSAAPLILFERLERIDSTEDTRFPLWRGAFKAVLSSNFMGLGIGQFKTRFREFYLTANEKTIYENVNRGAHLSPHSDYVAITVTYGLFGLICYFLFLFFSFKSMLQKLRMVGTPKAHLHLQFCLMVLVALAIFGVTSENFTSAIYWTSLAISTKTITQL